jgi:hypothetical protein
MYENDPHYCFACADANAYLEMSNTDLTVATPVTGTVQYYGTCICNEGYFLDNAICVEIDACDPEDCETCSSDKK